MRLNFQVVGNGAPLVILHGLLGSLDNWAPYARTLATRFQVFLPDLRNHGRSPHAPECNYDVMAADLAEFRADHQLGAINLLGHSLGGKVAMRFAQLHPTAVARLIVADMAPREYPPRYANILTAMHELDLSRFQERTEVEAALTGVAPDRNIRQFLIKNLGRDEQGRLRWKPNLSALRENYHHLRAALPAAGPFGGAALFIRGGRSDYIRAADWPGIQQRFPTARLETLPTAGHWVHAEAPAAFLELVSGFLGAPG